MELDEASLVEIFSRVEDAGQLAKCSLVCRRWRELRWAVSSLSFFFWRHESMDLKVKEDIIANVLRHSKTKAPGCLKSLKVYVRGDTPPTCHWLVYAAESVTELELHLSVCDLSLWSLLSLFHALESLKIHSGRSVCVDPFLPMANESPFTTLRSCSVDGALDVLKAMVAACPCLKDLRFRGFVVDTSWGSIQVVSSSLEYLELSIMEDWVPRGREQDKVVFLDMPRLGTLIYGCYQDRSKLCIVSTDNLKELELDACTFLDQRPFGKLTKLTLLSEWSAEQMVAVVKLSPRVAEFDIQNLRFPLGVQQQLQLGEVLSLLPVLRTLHCSFDSLLSFSGIGTLVVEELTVRYWITQEVDDYTTCGLVEDLLRVNCVRMVVVHYSPVQIRYMAKEWQLFLNLEPLYPGRVKYEQSNDDGELLDDEDDGE